MSCSCNQSPCVCVTCDSSSETTSSVLNNLITHFFGSLVKTCVNGQIIWREPCDLSAEIAGVPRIQDEALACYLMRAMEDVQTRLTPITPVPPIPPVPPEPAPCSCPVGLASTYTVQDFATDLSTACTDGDAGPGTPWDGTFNGTCPLWNINAGSTFEGKPIEGYLVLSACEWVIHIQCSGSSTPPFDLVVWDGNKTTGLTPAGDYTQTGGCGAATITII